MLHDANFMKKGFTLIEMLVSAGIMALLSIIITQIFVATTRNSTKTEVLTDLRQNGNYALGTLERMIRSAKNVSSTCDGTASNAITITNQDNLMTTFSCVMDVDLSIPRIASVSTEFGTEYITNKNYVLGTDCSSITPPFTCTSGTNYPSVAISFQLQQKSASASQYEKAVETFTTRVTLRN